MVSPPPLLSSFLLALLLLSSTTVISQSQFLEKSALLDFKNHLSGPAGALDQWLDAEDHCSWPGILCNTQSGVVALNISGHRRSLAGTLSPAVGRLSELRVLSLPFQNIRGEIPDEIWGLEFLEVLDLEGNSLSGRLPSRFSSHLRVINLGSNSLYGDIPAELSSCTEFEVLDLSRNQFTGTVPGFLGNLSRLREVRLGFNRLGGSIPEEIGSLGCSGLEFLDLSGNLLSGVVPASLGSCRRIQTLLLFSNNLNGSIPSEFGQLKELRVLDVSRNGLSGVVPRELGNCLKLSVLVLSDLLDDRVGEDHGNRVVSEESNFFRGRLDENITSLPQLRVLWAPRVKFDGLIPRNWGSCENLEVVNLGENLFTGSIPEAFTICKNMKFLNLSMNKLSGELAKELPVPCINVFDVSGNQLSGSIPRFISDRCTLVWFPSGELTSSYSSIFTYRILTRLPYPMFESGDDFLVYHNFGNNKFSGVLPSLPLAIGRFGNRTAYAFLASGNKLVGSLSSTILEKCTKLKGLIINMSNNMISGEITSEVGATCKSIVFLDISQNNISGTIPSSLGSLESLVVMDLSRNHLQGHIPDSFRRLKSLKYLSLANNSLSGHIPSGLGQLLSLEVLDLSSNSFVGKIPEDLLALKGLDILLLNDINLSGTVPSIISHAIITCCNVMGNHLSKSYPLGSFSTRRVSLEGNSDSSAAGISPQPGSSGSKGNGGLNSMEIASIISVSLIVAVLLALTVVLLVHVYTKKFAHRSSVQPPIAKFVKSFVDIGVPLTYENVVQASRGFNASNCIGSGGFGATYKAEISPGVLVAVKKLAVGRIQGVQQFQTEIKILGRCRHSNLVTLIGYHISESEMFLIYNYFPGGNLDRFIQERFKRPVDWKMLHKIALDVAHALAYLHDQCVPRILHRDVKPSNILLDNECNAYLSDFGLARLLGTSETHATTGVAGTFGYVAPEYAMTCRVSDKADVYSYGVVLLELISNKKALDPSFSPYGNGFNIVTWASMLLDKGRAHEFFAEGLWDIAPHSDLVEILNLGIKCTVGTLSIRPPMRHVVRRLEELQPPSS